MPSLHEPSLHETRTQVYMRWVLTVALSVSFGCLLGWVLNIDVRINKEPADYLSDIICLRVGKLSFLCSMCILCILFV